MSFSENFVYAQNGWSPNSCHAYHAKYSIPYSQALCLKRSFSEDSSYNKRCNELRGIVKGDRVLPL